MSGQEAAPKVVLTMQGITKEYQMGEETQQVLRLSLIHISEPTRP